MKQKQTMKPLTFNIPISDDPAAIAERYIQNNWGFNFYAGEPVQLPTGNYKVPIHVAMPNLISLPEKDRSFVIKYDNVGFLEIRPGYLNPVYKVLKSEIEDQVLVKLGHDWNEAQGIVLKNHPYVWGNLNRVRIFLHPMYKILQYFIERNSERSVEFEGLERYVQFLVEKELLRQVEDSQGIYYEMGNKLAFIRETALNDNVVLNSTEIATRVVGWLISNNFPDVVKRFKAAAFLSPYLSFIQTYYIDCFQCNELINFPEQALIQKNRSCRKRIRPMKMHYKIDVTNDKMFLQEVTSNLILERQEDRDNRFWGIIKGIETDFKEMSRFAQPIISASHEIVGGIM